MWSVYGPSIVMKDGMFFCFHVSLLKSQPELKIQRLFMCDRVDFLREPMTNRVWNEVFTTPEFKTHQFLSCFSAWTQLLFLLEKLLHKVSVLVLRISDAAAVTESRAESHSRQKVRWLQLQASSKQNQPLCCKFFAKMWTFSGSFWAFVYFLTFWMICFTSVYRCSP